MRTAVLCLAGGLAGLLIGDYAGIANSSGFASHATQAAGLRQDVMRSGKADRLSTVPARSPQPRIAIVEVVGVERAAIVYRDREGRELYRTDPVGNATVVVRGLSLPAVTLREAARSAIEPVVLDSTPLRNKPQPSAGRPKLPEGCEPAYSPLTGTALSSLHARCVASLAVPLRLAALH
jgi:hypothetical protein